MLAKSRLVILGICLSATLNISAQSLDHQDHLDTANKETNNYKVDIRIDPLLLAFSDIDIGIEFFIKKDMSFEMMLTYITRRMEEFNPFSSFQAFETDGFGMEVYFKKYLWENHNYNGTFISPYFRYRNISGPNTSNDLRMQNKRYAIGICGGGKIMITERLSIEIMLGFGYAISNRFEYTPALTRELNYLLTDFDAIIRLPLAYRF